jgi:hypothetical protein
MMARERPPWEEVDGEADDPRSHPAVRQYTLFSVVALLLLTVLLVQRDLGWWGMLPVLAGALSLLIHWTLGPATVVMLVGTLIFLQDALVRLPRGYRPPSDPVSDLLLCAAVLVFAATQYRVQSLVHSVFPADPHRPPGLRDPDTRPAVGHKAPPQRRSVGLVRAEERLLLLVGLALAMGLASVSWWYISASEPPWYFRRGHWSAFWRALQVAWAVCLVGVLAGALRSWVNSTVTRPEEAMVYLQDQQWRQTRAEQASLNRWLVWRRLRAQRRKEGR